jgi:hypothetical protein
MVTRTSSMRPAVVKLLLSYPNLLPYLQAWWLAFLVRAVIYAPNELLSVPIVNDRTPYPVFALWRTLCEFSGRPHLIGGSNRGKPQVQPGSPHQGSMFYSCCVSLCRMREVLWHSSGTGVLNEPPHPTSSLLPPFKGAKKPPQWNLGLFGAVVKNQTAHASTVPNAFCLALCLLGPTAYAGSHCFTHP